MSQLDVHGSSDTPFDPVYEGKVHAAVRSMGHLFQAGAEDSLHDLYRLVALQIGGSEHDEALQASVKRALTSEPSIERVADQAFKRGTRLARSPTQISQLASSADNEVSISRPQAEIRRSALPGPVRELLNLNGLRYEGALLSGIFREAPLRAQQLKEFFPLALEHAGDVNQLLLSRGYRPDQLPWIRAQLAKFYFNEYLPESAKLTAPLEGLPRDGMGGKSTGPLPPSVHQEKVAQARELVQGNRQLLELFQALHLICEEARKGSDAASIREGTLAIMGGSLFKPCLSTDPLVAGTYNQNCKDTMQFILENYEAICR